MGWRVSAGPVQEVIQHLEAGGPRRTCSCRGRDPVVFLVVCQRQGNDSVTPREIRSSKVPVHSQTTGHSGVCTITCREAFMQLRIQSTAALKKVPCWEAASVHILGDE